MDDKRRRWAVMDVMLDDKQRRLYLVDLAKEDDMKLFDPDDGSAMTGILSALIVLLVFTGFILLVRFVVQLIWFR